MNGYTSLSASITDGRRQALGPRARRRSACSSISRVLAAAPLRLIRAGLGDSACRPTAQADWLLSHLLLDRPYREAPFALLAADEAALFAQARALVAGDLEAMRHLVRTLVLSGFGMTICNGSYPASQGEHLLSHYVEMMQPPGLPDAFHGEQIGVCTIAMARLQERILAADAPPVLRPTTAYARRRASRHFGPVRGEACWRELADEARSIARAPTRSTRGSPRGWDAMRARIAAGHARRRAH